MKKKYKSWPRPLLAVSLVVFLAVAISACGGGDDSSSSATSADTESTGKAPEGEPVKLGMIAPIGTVKYNIPNEVAEVKAGVAALNARGGLGGRPVELVYCNDKGEATFTTSCAREMVSEEVIAMVGGGALNGNLLPPILEKGNISTLGANAFTPDELNAPSYYYFSGGSFASFTLLAAYASKVGLSQSLFLAAEPAAQNLIPALDEAAEKGGAPFVATVEMALNQSDFAPIIAAGKPDEAEAALLFTSGSQSAQVIAAAESAGVDWKQMYQNEPNKEIIEAYGGTVDNFLFATPFPALSSDDPDIVRFKKELEEGVEDGIPDAESALEAPTWVGVQGWLGIQVIEQFYNEGLIKDLTADGVSKALQNTKDANIGLIESWSPNEPGPEGLSRVSNNAFNIVEITDGKEEQLTKEPIVIEEIWNDEVSF